MILYKKNNLLSYKDIGGTNRIKSIEGAHAEFDDLPDDRIKISIYRQEGREHKNFFVKEFNVNEILDENNIAYGTTYSDVAENYNTGEGVNIKNESGDYIDTQNPLPTNGDTVYGKDVDLARSSSTGWTGDLLNLFGDLELGLTRSDATNPKTFTVYFERTIITNGMGVSSNTGTFSNLKIISLLSGGVEITLYDNSTDNTDKTVAQIEFTPTGFTGLRFEFYTADAVTLTNVVISKSRAVTARIQGQSELTSTIENISSYRNALNINSAWVHRKIVNETFHQETATTTTLSVAATEGDTAITVTDATGFAIGEEIKLKETVSGVGVQEIGLMTITNVVGSVITLDRPLGNDYTTSADVIEVESNMSVVGTLASPKAFKVEAPDGTVWQMTRILISLTHAGAPDDGRFGGIAALTNGVCMRATTAAGRVVTFANWKTNGDMKLDMYDVTYTDKAPAGENGTNGRWTFTRAEVVAELDGDATPIQKLECLVQDDITGNSSFTIRAQGRVFSP